MLDKVPLFLKAWFVVALANTLITAPSFEGPPAFAVVRVGLLLLWAVALYRRVRIAWYVSLYLLASGILYAATAEGGPNPATHDVLAAVAEIALLVSPQARAWFEHRQPLLRPRAD